MRSRNPFRPLAFLATILALGGVVGAVDRGSASKSKVADGGPRLGAIEALEWFDYGEALQRAQKADKHLLVDFYTNWCGWCKRMDRDTYGDSAVATYLRAHFVLSRVNAESDKRFKVGDGTMSGSEVARDFRVNSYPITWFLKPDGSRLDKIPGYVPPDRFINALVFVHERKYDKQSGH